MKKLTLKRLEEMCKEARDKGYDDQDIVSFFDHEWGNWTDLNEEDFRI